MDSRIDKIEKETTNRFEEIAERLQKVENRTTSTSSSAAASSPTPSSSSPAGTAMSTSTSRETPVVFVRGFPNQLPRVVLKEYCAEVLGCIPAAARDQVKPRICPVDDQFSLAFPDGTAAKKFIEAFSDREFFYQSPSKEESALKVVMGKPLAVRRRGAAIRPVCEALRAILDKKRLVGTDITQTSYPRAGIWHTEFYGEEDRVVVPFFRLKYAEDKYETKICEVKDLNDGQALSPSELAAIRAAARLE